MEKIDLIRKRKNTEKNDGRVQITKEIKAKLIIKESRYMKLRNVDLLNL